MELRLNNEDDRHSVVIPGAVDMISRVSMHGGVCHDVTLVVRMDDRSAAIERYPHLGNYWITRFRGEMS